MSNKSEPNEEDVRTEYEALTAYGRQIVIFRFTLLGFYLTLIGFLVLRGSPSAGEYLLLCLLTIGLWILELRNRALLKILDNRGIQIEKKHWKYESREEDAFITLQHKDRPNRRIISHGFALNLIYLTVFLYSLLNFYYQLCKWLCPSFKCYLNHLFH